MNDAIEKIMMNKEVHFPEKFLNNIYSFNAKGDLLVKHLNQICYGTLSYSGRTKTKYLMATHKKDNYGHGDEVFDELNYRFTDFLINQSQFRGCFAIHDTEWCVEKKGVCVSGDLPSNLVIFLLTIHRAIVEYTYIVHSWDTLRKHMDPNVALYVAHYFVKDPDGTFSFYSPRGAHTALSSGYGCKEELENFVKADIQRANSLYSECTEYRGVNATFLPPGMGVRGWKQPGGPPRTKEINPFIRIESLPLINSQVQVWAELNGIENLIRWQK